MVGSLYWLMSGYLFYWVGFIIAFICLFTYYTTVYQHAWWESVKAQVKGRSNYAYEKVRLWLIISCVPVIAIGYCIGSRLWYLYELCKKTRYSRAHRRVHNAYNQVTTLDYSEYSDNLSGIYSEVTEQTSCQESPRGPPPTQVSSDSSIYQSCASDLESPPPGGPAERELTAKTSTELELTGGTSTETFPRFSSGVPSSLTTTTNLTNTLSSISSARYPSEASTTGSGVKFALSEVRIDKV